MAMNITLKNGEVREYAPGTTAMDIIAGIGEGLARRAVAARLDDRTVDLNTPVFRDAVLTALTFDDEEGRHTYRHTAAHILAQAVKRLYPGAKLAIGPAIENGFYYDFDVDAPFSVEDFDAIEAEMEKIVAEKLPIRRFELPREEAIALTVKMGEPYKTELIRDLPGDAVISFYQQGEYVDLCAGPHLPDTGRVKAVKLLSVAGAYWRGRTRCSSVSMARPSTTGKNSKHTGTAWRRRKNGITASWAGNSTSSAFWTRDRVFPSSIPRA
jgi:threonyl-tRNA synthetase